MICTEFVCNKINYSAIYYTFNKARQVDRLHEFLRLLITPKSHLQHAVVYLTAAEVEKICKK